MSSIQTLVPLRFLTFGFPSTIDVNACSTAGILRPVLATGPMMPGDLAVKPSSASNASFCDDTCCRKARRGSRLRSRASSSSCLLRNDCSGSLCRETGAFAWLYRQGVSLSENSDRCHSQHRCPRSARPLAMTAQYSSRFHPGYSRSTCAVDRDLSPIRRLFASGRNRPERP